MIFVLLGISLLFILVGFLVTKNNASYVLAGYNTMPEDERSNFELAAYLHYFKKFHLILGFSYFLIGLILYEWVDVDAAGIFIGIYPVMAYLYFIVQSQKFNKNRSLNKKANAGVIIGVITLLFLAGIFGLGYQENSLTVESKRIKISGIYGEEIPLSQIASVALIDDLPIITLKTNGFASGNSRKGYFKTNTGENVKLILNSDNYPCILIRKKTGPSIYFSARKIPNKIIITEIKNLLPELAYKQE